MMEYLQNVSHAYLIHSWLQFEITSEQLLKEIYNER